MRWAWGRYYDIIFINSNSRPLQIRSILNVIDIHFFYIRRIFSIKVFCSPFADGACVPHSAYLTTMIGKIWRKRRKKLSSFCYGLGRAVFGLARWTHLEQCCAALPLTAKINFPSWDLREFLMEKLVSLIHYFGVASAINWGILCYDNLSFSAECFVGLFSPLSLSLSKWHASACCSLGVRRAKVFPCVLPPKTIYSETFYFFIIRKWCEPSGEPSAHFFFWNTTQSWWCNSWEYHFFFCFFSLVLFNVCVAEANEKNSLCSFVCFPAKYRTMNHFVSVDAIVWRRTDARVTHLKRKWKYFATDEITWN